MIKISLFVFLMLSVCSFAVAQEEARATVKISSLQGAAQIKVAKKEWSAASAGMTLNQGDIIRTRPGSWALLNVYDEKNKQLASIELKQNSELRFIKLQPSKDILFDLALGEAFVKAEKLNGIKAQCQVKTPTSFIEVKGKATFSVNVEKIQ